MGFQEELKAVLQIEKEGEVRLHRAEDEAQQIVAEADREAQLVLREAEQLLVRERHAAEEENRREIERLEAELDRTEQAEENRLAALAGERRETAVARILAWLWMEH